MSHLAGKRIFVVEDEALVLMMLTDMLEELGLTIAATAGGLDQAVSLARTTDCDLAILDMNLNGRLSYPVGDILQQRHIPFAFATGYGDGMKEAKYAAVPILGKPYDSDQLKQTLAGLFVTVSI